MKVNDLIKFLKRFKNAEVMVNNQPICVEAYQDETGKLVINLKILFDKEKKTLD